MKNTILLTNDVETTSIVNGGLRPETGVKVWKEGLPLLLDIYARYEIQTTFFVVADFAYECPEIVRMLLAEGHEVGLHGLTHDYRRSFVFSLNVGLNVFLWLLAGLLFTDGSEVV
ncbi:MAG: polysaccharide deacetylase family protein [Bacteroidales bacterium]